MSTCDLAHELADHIEMCLIQFEAGLLFIVIEKSGFPMNVRNNTTVTLIQNQQG